MEHIKLINTNLYLSTNYSESAAVRTKITSNIGEYIFCFDRWNKYPYIRKQTNNIININNYITQKKIHITKILYTCLYINKVYENRGFLEHKCIILFCSNAQRGITLAVRSWLYDKFGILFHLGAPCFIYASCNISFLGVKMCICI